MGDHRFFGVGQNRGIKFLRLSYACVTGAPIVAEKRVVIIRVGWKEIVVITGIEVCRSGELFEVAHAINLSAAFFGAREGRQEHGREDRDNRNHDEQLDQREGAVAECSIYPCGE